MLNCTHLRSDFFKKGSDVILKTLFVMLIRHYEGVLTIFCCYLHIYLVPYVEQDICYKIKLDTGSLR